MTKDWNPGHDIVKGYPYGKIESVDAFKNRIDVGINDDGNPFLGVDKSVFPNCPDFGDPLTEQENFLLNRVIDFKKALVVTEDQITAILEERPFIPEELNFELLHKNEQITEPPIRIYGPKYDHDFSIYRKPGSAQDPNWNPAMWTVIMNKDGETKEITLSLPCRRIAYTVFSAFGIKLVPERIIESEGTVAPIREESPIK